MLPSMAAWHRFATWMTCQARPSTISHDQATIKSRRRRSIATPTIIPQANTESKYSNDVRSDVGLSEHAEQLGLVTHGAIQHPLLPGVGQCAVLLHVGDVVVDDEGGNLVASFFRMQSTAEV